MRRLTVTTVGAWCAILMLPLLVVGGALIGSTDAGDLIPETGDPGRDWLAAVADAPGRFAGGGWLLVLMGYLGLVALIGFYWVLRDAAPFMILAPILGAVGMTLVQVSHLVPIAMAYELAPAYVEATGSEQATLGTTADTLAALCLVVNAAGNALGWGVAVPLYAWAILTTRALPRWIGWLGVAVAVLAGWLGLLAPASDVAEGISSLGFVAFFVFMPSMGVAILRREHRATSPPPAADRPPSAAPA